MFKSFKNWLNEREEPRQGRGFNDIEEEEEPLYGCIMMNADINDWTEFHLSGIDEEDLYEKNSDDSYGLEETPHLTVLYGIHEDEIDPKIVEQLIRENMKYMILEVSSIGVFEGEEYDVVKYDLPLTRQLQRYRDLFLKLPNTQDFTDYNPHMTIAYVKPGKGEKYGRELSEPFKVRFNKAVYSYHPDPDNNPDETKTKIISLEK